MTSSRTATDRPRPIHSGSTGHQDPGAIRLPEVKQERIDGLRRMKRIAVSLLLVAAVVYVLCRVLGDDHGVWGYVQATAEASMVGGLADWFAVTALFRHPLGIPIPHTAIIPNKKDQIGEGLAGFVQEYFLTTEVLAERVAAARVPERFGEWLADPEHAHRLAEELSNAISGLATVLRDDELRHSVAAFADKRLREMDIAALLARLIEAICDAGQHQAALGTFLRGARHFLDDNRAVFRRQVSHESPDWVPDWLDDRVFNKGSACCSPSSTMSSTTRNTAFARASTRSFGSWPSSCAMTRTGSRAWKRHGTRFWTTPTCTSTSTISGTR